MDTAWDGCNMPGDGLGLVRGVQGAGTPPGLHDTGHPRQYRNDPAALEKPVARGRVTRGLLRHRQAVGPARMAAARSAFPDG